MILVQITFPFDGPWGEAMAAEFRGLAESINAEPGFVSKLWLEDPAAGRSGGCYLFTDRAAAEAYVGMHTERLAGFGITGVEARYFTVNEPLSRLNHGLA